MKRYVIQILWLEDSLRRDQNVEWKHYYSAKASHTLRGARKEWWRLVQTKWDFPADRPLFRIYDRKKGEAIY